MGVWTSKDLEEWGGGEVFHYKWGVCMNGGVQERVGSQHFRIASSLSIDNKNLNSMYFLQKKTNSLSCDNHSSLI